MSKVTKTILILQLDSWIAAHSRASCCSLSASSLPCLHTVRDTHPHCPCRPELSQSKKLSDNWGTATLSYQEICVELHVVLKCPIPADGRGRQGGGSELVAEGAVWPPCPAERQPPLLFELRTNLCSVLPSKQSAVKPSH